MRCLLAIAAFSILAPSQIVTKPETPTKSGVTWESSVDDALARAKRESKPVMWTIMIHREVACRRMMRRTWTDPAVVSKAKGFVLIPCNVYATPDERLFPGVTVAQVRANETVMRARYGEGKEVVAPQHIITDADGKVLVRKTYELDTQELIRLMDRGLRKTGKDVAADKPADTKGPADPPKPDPAADSPDDEEPEAPTEEDARLVRMIIKSPSNEKEDLTDELLDTSGLPGVELLMQAISKKKIRSEKDRAAIVRRLGYEKHARMAKALLPLVSDKSKSVRNAAVVSLEEMKHPVATEPLIKRFAKERDPEVNKHILRALGLVAPGNKPALDLLTKHAKKRTKLGQNALMSLGPHLQGDPDVRKLLLERWPKTDKKFHLAILYSYWTARDPETADDLKKIKKRERSGTDYDLAEQVLAVIEDRRPETNDRGGGGRRGGRGRDLRRLLGGEWGLIMAFRPLFDEDKVERNVSKDFRARNWGR
ncbi:MAG: HEAT repeat domain-containing protein [Planctomycetes bacterium]|nr:HEAT repeat domain-containing protein [Planctomycetota bacterium]